MMLQQYELLDRLLAEPGRIPTEAEALACVAYLRQYALPGFHSQPAIDGLRRYIERGPGSRQWLERAINGPAMVAGMGEPQEGSML